MEFAKSATDESDTGDVLVDPQNADGCFTSKNNRGPNDNTSNSFFISVLCKARGSAV